MNDEDSKALCEKMIDFFAASIEGTDIHPHWLITTFISMLYTSMANMDMKDKFNVINHVNETLLNLAKMEVRDRDPFSHNYIDVSRKSSDVKMLK